MEMNRSKILKILIVVLLSLFTVGYAGNVAFAHDSTFESIKETGQVADVSADELSDIQLVTALSTRSSCGSGGNWANFCQLSRGSRGASVAAMQTILWCHGYLGKRYNSEQNYVDGIFGYNTQKAVEAYQKDHGLRADGIVGSGTWIKLRGELSYRSYSRVKGYPINRWYYQTTGCYGQSRFILQRADNSTGGSWILQYGGPYYWKTLGN